VSHSEEDQAGARESAPQMSARTDSDMIVLFDLPAGESPDAWAGRIVPVRITSATSLSLHAMLQP